MKRQLTQAEQDYRSWRRRVRGDLTDDEIVLHEPYANDRCAQAVLRLLKMCNRNLNENIPVAQFLMALHEGETWAPDIWKLFLLSRKTVIKDVLVILCEFGEGRIDIERYIVRGTKLFRDMERYVPKRPER